MRTQKGHPLVESDSRQLRGGAEFARSTKVTLKDVVEVAPIATATIAFVAACIAVGSIRYQGTLARRRATVDFFVKFETDDRLVEFYYTFRREMKNLVQGAPLNTILESSSFRSVRTFLDLCELLCAGIRHRAFSESIAFHYWGDVLRDSFREAKPIIEHLRRTEKRHATYCDFEWLCERWRFRD